ncbi:phage minor head protein [Brevundimonas faecalis]|uniref:phage head morphogenesis protein n=1 Tax=Brevundimonas faecalis TaxID=947378 RepID=UPI0036120203
MADHPARPGFSFSDAPSPEVSAYLRQKGLRPAFRASEVWGQEHAHAFTVALATQLDVLATLKEAVQYAIDKGVPFESWARDLTPELQRLGWWGQADIADPATGEVKLRQLGSPHRLRTIYQANLRSARAAGQWERGQRTKSVLPFYLYQLGPSERHREEHKAREGMIRPVDDPVWETWYPPNGWGCKCWLRQITRAEANRRGVSDPVEIEMIPHRRQRDDGSYETVHAPVGIDPEWATNPGLSRARTLMTNLSDRLASAGEPAARALAADLWSGSTPEALASQPPPRDPQAKARRFLAPVAVLSDRTMAQTGATNRVALIGSDYLAKITSADPRLGHGHGAAPTRPQDLGLVQRILDDGELIERADRRSVYVLEIDGRAWRLAVRTTGAGELAVLTLFASSARASDAVRRRAKKQK